MRRVAMAVRVSASLRPYRQDIVDEESGDGGARLRQSEVGAGYHPDVGHQQVP